MLFVISSLLPFHSQIKKNTDDFRLPFHFFMRWNYFPKLITNLNMLRFFKKLVFPDCILLL